MAFVVSDREKTRKNSVNITCHAAYKYIRSLELLPLGNGLWSSHTAYLNSSFPLLSPFQMYICHLIRSDLMILAHAVSWCVGRVAQSV